MNMDKPKVIFLDAMGTLFGLRATVGQVYARIASDFGVTVSPEILDKTFRRCFKTANPLAFPDVEASQIPEFEFQWWRAVAYSTFSQAGVMGQFSDFSTFFVQLYDYFACPEPWYVYQDVFPALNTWKNQGIPLGLISNFDSRLYYILDGLGLQEFFETITISSRIGAAKPDKKVFLTSLDKYDILPQEAWHIGDDLKEDYYGAKNAGLKAFLLER